MVIEVLLPSKEKSLILNTGNGYRLYRLRNITDIELIFSDNVSDICLIERMLSTHLMIIVTTAAPRKFRLFNVKNEVTIYEDTCADTIRSVRINRSWIVIFMEHQIEIRSLNAVKVKHTITNAFPNPLGVCDLSQNNDLLAYPGGNIGEVTIFNVKSSCPVTMIPAHDGALAVFAFNQSASLIATASEKGTVIRVFQTSNGQNMYQFRRGALYADVCSLSFSACGGFLSCSSNRQTVHVFKLNTTEERRWFSRWVPGSVVEPMIQERAFAKAQLPVDGGKTVATITMIENKQVLVVCTDTNNLLIYYFDVRTGDVIQAAHKCLVAGPNKMNRLTASTSSSQSGSVSVDSDDDVFYSL